MPRPRTIARLIVLLLLLVLAAVAVLLANIDPNNYRLEVETTLSDLLGRPVHFSSIGYSLREGFAIDCRDLELPPVGQSPLSLKADHLYLKLAILPLLQGDLDLRQLILQRPRLDVDLRQPAAGSTGSQAAAKRPSAARLNKLRIRDGRLRLLTGNGRAGQAATEFTDLQLDLQGRTGGRLAVQLETRSRFEGQAARLSLKGEFDAPWSRDYQSNRLDLQMQLRHLPLAAAERLGLTGVHLTGQAFLAIEAQGSLQDGLSLRSTLTASQAQFRVAGASPRPLGQWRLATLLTLTEGDGWQFSQTRLEHGDLSLSGELTWQDQTLGGQLELPTTDLGRILEFVPLGALPLDQLQLLGGQLAMRLSLAPTPTAQLGTRAILNQLSGQLDLTGIELEIRRLGRLQNIAGRLELADGQLHSRQVTATWEGLRQQLHGDLQLAEQTADLYATLEIPATRITALLPPTTAKQFPLAGTLTLKGALQGKRDNFRLNLDAGLDGLAADIAGWLAKDRGDKGQLHATLDYQQGRWLIADGRLMLDAGTLLADGDWQNRNDWTLKLKGERLDLAALLEKSHHLAAHRIHGKATLDLHLKGTGQGHPDLKGLVRLHDAGAHLTRVIADLQQVNGTVVLTGWGFASQLLSARLGNSPVSLQTQLDNFSHAEQKIHIQGKSLLAHELIFPSRSAMLRQLDGRLTISARGIDFDRVRVRLDGGTDCLVSGAMQGWHQPHLALDIRADYADIDEVIALWHKPSSAPAQPAKTTTTAQADHQGPTVTITAHVARGKLSRLNFENAAGTISSNGRGLLRIAPLAFHAGEGYGNGQVTVESASGRPSRLKISGHVENFPAEGIHRDLLHRKSLLSGTLRGDFYLEGLAGADFLRTSQGGINMEVNRGVLKRFQVFSKLFSLLNVSQLFSLKLPDMAEEGMPFEKIDATFSLSQGLLHSEDLLVHSEAMDISVVGDYDLTSNRLDAIFGVKPLKTVDRIITKIPIAGWLLTGKEKALVTAHFQVRGSADDPEVLPIPITSLSDKVFGIFKRVLTLPGKVITDPGKVILPQSVNPKE